MDFQIRRAADGDIPAIAPLFGAYRQFYGLESDVQASSAYLAERLARGESVILLAAGGAGEVVGFAQLYPTFSSLSLTRAWVLYDLYVAPSARRKGVGKALMEVAHRLALESGASYIRLETAVDNGPAQRLYEKLGYSRDEEFYTYYLHIKTG